MNKKIELEKQVEILNLLIEFGADEAHESTPINRFDSTSDVYKLGSSNVNYNRPISLKKMKGQSFAAISKIDELSRSVNSIEELRSILEKSEEFSAPKISDKMNFSFGNQGAKVMVLCDPPGREEISEKNIFAGERGRIFDKMYKAIGLSIEEESLYAVPIFPWRLPPSLENLELDLALICPFVSEHLSIVKPKILVIMTELFEKMRILTDVSKSTNDGQFIPRATKNFTIASPNRLIDFPDEKKVAWETLKEIKRLLGRENGQIFIQ